MKDTIVCLDVETTGLNPKEDYIIQLAMVKFDSKTFDTIDKRSWYIRPIHSYTMSEQAQEKHNLSKEFIEENGVDLRAIAPHIIEFLKGSDILTYNGNHFDINFLYKDLKIIGVELPMDDIVFYDAFAIYKSLHPSTLSAVYKQYTGKELEGAHDAYNDVNATIEVFKHVSKEVDNIDEMKENSLISPENSIYLNNQELYFTNGKYKDCEFMTVIMKDYLYVKWFLENVASDRTKSILRNYYKIHSAALKYS